MAKRSRFPSLIMSNATGLSGGVGPWRSQQRHSGSGARSNGHALCVSVVAYVWHNISVYTCAVWPSCYVSHTHAEQRNLSKLQKWVSRRGRAEASLPDRKQELSTNGVYLVSPSLGTYPEECFGFYISLTFLWSSDIPEVCKVSLLSFMQAIIRLLIKEGRLPQVVNYQNMPNGSPLPRKLFVSTWLFFLTLQLVCSSSLLCTLRNWLDWYNSRDEGITFQITLVRHPSVLQTVTLIRVVFKGIKSVQTVRSYELYRWDSLDLKEPCRSPVTCLKVPEFNLLRLQNFLSGSDYI